MVEKVVIKRVHPQLGEISTPELIRGEDITDIQIQIAAGLFLCQGCQNVQVFIDDVDRSHEFLLNQEAIHEPIKLEASSLMDNEERSSFDKLMKNIISRPRKRNVGMVLSEKTINLLEGDQKDREWLISTLNLDRSKPNVLLPSPKTNCD